MISSRQGVRARTRLLVLLATVASLVMAIGFAPAGGADPAEPVPPGATPLPEGGVVVQQETTPAAGIRAGATTVGIAADSIGLDATGDIAQIVGAEFPIVYNEMYLGSAIRHHYYRVAEAVQGPNGPDVMIVILGTAETNHEPSSAEFRLHMRRFLDAVSPHVDCVRWFDTQIADAENIYYQFNEHHDRINSLIHEVTAEYANVEYVHYGEWTEMAPPGYIDVDRLHLARRGRIELGRMIVQAARGCDEPTDVAGFWDVKTDYWAADAIDWLTGQGLADGFDNRSFRARIGTLDFDITRGQVARMVWRLAGSPDVGSDHPWADGPAWLGSALDWLDASDLADGYGDGTFRPNDPITRGAVIRLLWRLVGSPEVSELHPWKDGAPWIDGALNWAAQEELLNGFFDDTVRPGAPITRAQIASLLHEFAPLLEAPPPAGPESTVIAPTTTADAVPSSTVPTTSTTAAPDAVEVPSSPAAS